MTDRHHFGIFEYLVFVGVLSAALAVRIWYVCACADYGRSSGPIIVQLERPELVEYARNLSAGRGYGLEEGGEFVPKAHPAPLYAYLLSAIYDYSDSASAVRQRVRWLQCGLGGMTAGFLFLFARLIFRSLWAAGCAGFLAGFYPFWIANTTAIDDGALCCFLLSAACYLGVRSSLFQGSLSGLLFGSSLAALALTRAALLPFAFVGLVWYLARCQSQGRGGRLALAAVVGFAAALAPWTIRNYQVFRDVYPVVDTTYFHLWMGNNPQADGGPLNVKPERLDLNERQQAQQVFNEVWSHPSKTLSRRLSAGLYFLLTVDWFRDEEQPTSEDSAPLLWREVAKSEWASINPPAWFDRYHRTILFLSLFFVYLFGFVGWRLSYRRRQDSGLLVAATFLLPLPYLVGHAEMLNGPRLPFDALWICYASFALACGLGRIPNKTPADNPSPNR
ncbi:MAG: hypothetical protein KatS3mg105_1649 [Gemmatales bacterium]|nr:MAG: hypothetical protein KatS3mg105_1649 [Gemmatales bacterium]